MGTSETEKMELNAKAEQAAKCCAALWLQGGLATHKSSTLFDAMPILKRLLQPIGNTTSPSAYILSQPLLAAFNELANLGEWQLVLLGLNEDIRGHWLSLAAARCSEAGSMQDPQVLIKLISQLGGASAWVLAVLEDKQAQPTIMPGPLNLLERELIGTSLNDNVATPSLLRVLRATFILDGAARKSTDVLAIPAIDASGKEPSQNWCAGRLLVVPNTLLKGVTPNQNWLLTEQSLKDDKLPLTELFQQQPWLFLLSILVFTQDAWAAEQRGGLLLSLPSGQDTFTPAEISVWVQGPEGDEVLLGSLADFLLAVLSQLQISLYPTQSNSSDLNRALGPLVASLLSQKIWQFKEGGRGELGFYGIHPDFGDACYSLPLFPIFGYKSPDLKKAIKESALRLREERLTGQRHR